VYRFVLDLISHSENFGAEEYELVPLRVHPLVLFTRCEFSPATCKLRLTPYVKPYVLGLQ